MKPKVVYDTNVLVSALLKEHSVPAYLISLAVTKQVRLFYSPPIWEEYTDVLHRPKFGFEARSVKAFLRDLRKAGSQVRHTTPVTVARDVDDNKFLECAQAARADYVVTGNTKHFPSPTFKRTRIVTPMEFVRILTSTNEDDD